MAPALTPKISIVVAVARNGVIGKDNALPWHLPGDLKRFKALTVGKPIIMGRKTFESIGKPLPGRLNIVLSRNTQLALPEGVLVAKNLDEALRLSGDVSEVSVIGGSAVFAEALPRCDRLYLTLIDKDFDGDAELPGFTNGTFLRGFHETSRQVVADPIPHAFADFERNA